jgi:hypothetical protein
MALSTRVEASVAPVVPARVVSPIHVGVHHGRAPQMSLVLAHASASGLASLKASDSLAVLPNETIMDIKMRLRNQGWFSSKSCLVIGKSCPEATCQPLENAWDCLLECPGLLGSCPLCSISNTAIVWRAVMERLLGNSCCCCFTSESAVPAYSTAARFIVQAKNPLLFVLTAWFCASCRRPGAGRCCTCV